MILERASEEKGFPPVPRLTGSGLPVRHADHDPDLDNRGAWQQFASVGSFRQQPFTLSGA